jgi:imidazoleglycerol-phosphate dehydratase
MTSRQATVSRNTSETKISVVLALDGSGKGVFNTGVPFLEHMLDQVAKHGMLDLTIECDGDNHIDDHHSVEDIGIALGQAFAEALGDKSGIRRYGASMVPLDEALSRVVLDFSGRPGLYYSCEFRRDKVGTFDVELAYEFFHGFVNHARATLHVDNLKGENEHHKLETMYKAFGRAIREAVEVDAKLGGKPASTKGVL